MNQRPCHGWKGWSWRSSLHDLNDPFAAVLLAQFLAVEIEAIAPGESLEEGDSIMSR